jgi:hypothetical protein
MFLGVLNLDPDPLVRMDSALYPDPARDPSIISQKYCSKKNLDSYSFVTSL